MKKCRFSGGWFFIYNFFDMGDTKIKMALSYSPHQAGSKHVLVLFDHERSILKFDLRSGQVKVRSRSNHDSSRSICTLRHVVIYQLFY